MNIGDRKMNRQQYIFFKEVLQNEKNFLYPLSKTSLEMIKIKTGAYKYVKLQKMSFKAH